MKIKKIKTWLFIIDNELDEVNFTEEDDIIHEEIELCIIEQVYGRIKDDKI